MENQELIKQVTEKAEKWLTPAYDAETQAEVKRMLENPDKTELIDSFYKDLEFGTGGLRGIMGAGQNLRHDYFAKLYGIQPMIYPIVIYGDEVLRKHCTPLEPGTLDVKQLEKDMFLTLEEAGGVGLAAPQIGKDIRFFIVDCTPWADNFEKE